MREHLRYGYRGRDSEPWQDLWRRLAWTHGVQEADHRYGRLEDGNARDLIAWRFLGTMKQQTVTSS